MMSKSLDLPDGELAKLAELQHQEELKRKLAAPPAPLLKGARELVLRQRETAYRSYGFCLVARFVTKALVSRIVRTKSIHGELFQGVGYVECGF